MKEVCMCTNAVGVSCTPFMYTEVFFFFLFAPKLGSLLPLLELRAEFPQFLDQGQSVGLLGRVISTHIHKH
jgi:hypothetical protein